MNLRCIYCQTPFTLARTEMLAAIVQMTEKNMNHYDAHCPRCRRANSISRQRMELFFPNWQEAAKQQPALSRLP
jgi:phage FluMu protein Com